MSSLLLDDDNDLAISTNNFVVVDGADYIEQSLKTRLQLFLGESFLDLNVGVPYFQEIFQKRVDSNRVESIFKEHILTTPGVIELLEFEIEYINSSRQFQVDFVVKTKDGIIELSEVIG